MISRAQYQKLREVVIELTVEIKDKDITCQLMEKKCNNERKLLGSLESMYNNEYEIKLEVLNHVNLNIQVFIFLFLFFSSV